MARIRLTPQEISEGLAGLKGWKAEGDSAITKQFTLKDHLTALGFVVKVAAFAETIDHHPDVRWVYDSVTFTLSTHDTGGVTPRDFDLAAGIERLR